MENDSKQLNMPLQERDFRLLKRIFALRLAFAGRSARKRERSAQRL